MRPSVEGLYHPLNSQTRIGPRSLPPRRHHGAGWSALDVEPRSSQSVPSELASKHRGGFSADPNLAGRILSQVDPPAAP